MTIFYLKIIVWAVSAALVIWLAMLALRYFQLKEALWEKYMSPQAGVGRHQQQLETARLRESWQKLKARVDKGQLADLKLGVIEADKLIDQALKMQGIEGQEMGERLKKAQEQGLRHLDQAWTVHKVRNRLVHGQGELSEGKLRLVFQEAERILRSWNII